jgi:transposase
MPAERLSMRKIKEILRLCLVLHLSNRKIGTSLDISPTTVSERVLRAKAAKLTWEQVEQMDETELEAMLYPPPIPSRQGRVPIDFEYVHRELKRKGVTLQLLWEEYRQNTGASGYQYSRYCDQYRKYCAGLDVVMRQDHRAGEKLFVDFSGDGICIRNPHTGELKEAPLFVAVLGASCYTYAEAFDSEESRCWIEGHVHAFEYMRGVPELLVPDNTRTAVTKACWYDPELNRTYRDLAKYYGTAVLPARKRKPKDKAKVENGVLIAQRWILAALRNHTFFSLQEANQAIKKKLVEFNTRKFKKLETTRRELLETVDRPALKPLPLVRYEYAEWRTPTVNVNYHVEIEKHNYSVPHGLVRRKLEARVTATTVELFFKGNRVASHPRSYTKGGYSTQKEHMPEAHRRYVEWTPERIVSWVGKAGPNTAKLAEKIMEAKDHPQQGFRACLGLIRLGKNFGSDRLEAACSRALLMGAYSYKSVHSILSRGLDRQTAGNLIQQTNLPPVQHENVRGPEYYN